MLFSTTCAHQLQADFTTIKKIDFIPHPAFVVGVFNGFNSVSRAAGNFLALL